MALRRRLVLPAFVVWVGLLGMDLPGALAQTTLMVQRHTDVMRSPLRGRGTRPVVATAASDWPQFNRDPQHSGDSPQESTISYANVATLVQVFQVTLPAIADGAPAYLSQVATATGIEDLLFVTTKAGDIVALDAHTGVQVWMHSNPAGACLINNVPPACYTTSSPAVDPNRQYVYSYGLDGMVHKYAVGTGIEVVGGEWPEVTTFKDDDEKGSSDLSIVTARSGVSYLYATNSGYPTDGGDYQGHLTAINLQTGAQLVFNSLCSNQPAHFVETPGLPDCPAVQSGIWGRPGTVYDPVLDRILLVSSNGSFAPAAFNWGDTVLSLNPDGSSAGGLPLDSYTPADFQDLDDEDLDLGSTAPAIIPIPANCNIPRVAAQAGKDSVLRLLNLDNLSGQGGAGHTGGELSTVNVPQGGEVVTQPATWVNPSDGSSWIFIANESGVSGLRLVVNVVNGMRVPALQPMWVEGPNGSSPIVANNVLYYASSGSLRALSPTTGVLLWQGTIGGIHWESPIVVNGVLYITDEHYHLTAFAPGLPPPTPVTLTSIVLPDVINVASNGC